MCVCVRGGVEARGPRFGPFLAEGGAAVGTPSLAQCEAEEDAQGEEEDGTQDPQAGEVVFQDAHSATHRRVVQI